MISLEFSSYCNFKGNNHMSYGSGTRIGDYNITWFSELAFGFDLQTSLITGCFQQDTTYNTSLYLECKSLFLRTFQILIFYLQQNVSIFAFESEYQYVVFPQIIIRHNQWTLSLYIFKKLIKACRICICDTDSCWFT
jgi:hypothetical protein